MSIRIEQACPKDFDRVWRFYADVCDAQATDKYSPDWHLGVYPSRADLEGHIADGDLYIAVDGEGDANPILGAMVLTGREDDDYLAVAWRYKVAPEDVCVLHLLATHPDARGRGVAKALLSGMVEIARARGKKTIHLDVVMGNLAASRLYEGFGFLSAGTARVHYDDIGDTDLWMYELPL